MIETVLALALTAVGLVALLGLLPHGLKVMKSASDRSVQARIAQELTGEVMLADWDAVDRYNYSGPQDLRYFDSEGVELIKDESEYFDSRIAYVVKIEIPEARSDDLSLPGSTSPDPDIKRVNVDIAALSIVGFTDFDKPEYANAVTSFTSTVVKMRRDHDNSNSAG